MSLTDFKILRNIKFPACAKEALALIDLSRNKQNWTMQLISEFVFMENSTKDIDSRRATSPVFVVTPMNSFQEFQLILVLIDFFSLPGPDSTRNAIFLLLFGTIMTQQRLKIVTHLISTAISTSSSHILSAAGVWVQQIGYTTAPCIEVTKSLVADFIRFSPHCSEQLKQLPMLAPHFAASFMTSAVELYFNEQYDEKAAPNTLVEIFAEWIMENPSLYVGIQPALALPKGVNEMPVETSLAGLFRWTILAPLFSDQMIYSHLHLSLLQILRDFGHTQPETTINAQHLQKIVTPVQAFCTKLTGENILPIENAAYKKCMDRFAQAIQVSLYYKCVYGDKSQLLCALETLPSHPLMSIVINSNKNQE